MKLFLCTFPVLALCLVICPLISDAQVPKDSASFAMHHASFEKGLFETDKVLEITLSGNIRELLNDRTSKNPEYFSLRLEYRAEDSSIVSIPIQAKTRGHFRRLKENCYYPPILLHFIRNETLKSSIFKENNKLKLAMPCQGDQFIIHEWLVYKLYNLITPKSFRVRLVRVTLDNGKSKKPVSPFYGMLLEEEQQMAKRNGFIEVNRKLRPEQTEINSFLTMAMFEYMIGNTDWSIQYLQNIKLLSADSNAVPIPVPYDFDMSGLVNTPYAKPAEELDLNSVRTRRYRGYCMQDMTKFDGIIALYNQLKKDIYGIITNCYLLDAKYINSTLKFLDEFYSTINNPATLKKEFGYPCDKNGTGNVIIKGLREE
jgi:hypothetical protein